MRNSAPVAPRRTSVTLGLALCVLLAACERRAAREAEVAAAVRSAYLLERQVLDARPPISTREDVVRVYRQGYADELANRLADLSWSPREGVVHPGGFAMEPPARVVTLRLTNETATVVFPTPATQQVLWLEKRFTIASLQRTGGRWRIVRSVSTERGPPELER